MLHKLLNALACLFLMAWVIGYAWVHAMACAFSTSPNCGMKMPWALGREDLALLVIYPGLVFLGLLVAIRWTRPGQNNDN